jgi:hypothetical protein
MKTTLTLLLVLFIGLNGIAQKKATDRELDGLEGEVKYLSNEYSEKNGAKRTESEYFYDKDGKLTEILYTASNFKYVYSVIDGFKTFKNVKIKKVNEPENVLRTAPIEEPKPIEKPEKLTAPDERFDFKYVYEYDSLNRIATERHFLNNNKLFRLTKYEYDDKERVRIEKVNDSVALTKFEYKYDKDGNLIKKLEDRDIKGAGFDSKNRTVYSDYKFDIQKNWTQRKSTRYYVTYGGKPEVMENYHYRTIKYY